MARPLKSRLLGLLSMFVLLVIFVAGCTTGGSDPVAQATIQALTEANAQLSTQVAELAAAHATPTPPGAAATQADPQPVADIADYARCCKRGCDGCDGRSAPRADCRYSHCTRRIDSHGSPVGQVHKPSVRDRYGQSTSRA